jgi:hypothetical protein
VQPWLFTKELQAMNPIRLDERASAIWCLIAGIFVAYLIALGAGLIRFVLVDIILVIALCAAGLALSVAYSTIRQDDRIARLARGMVELFLLSFLAGSLSYAAASLNRPLWDEVFAEWDRALGFDWHYWLAFLNANTLIHHVLAFAYLSMIPQMAIVLIALSAFSRFLALDTFLLAFGITALVTVTIAAFMPALSPLVHYGITPDQYPNITLAVPLEFTGQVEALRNGTLKIVDLSGAQGLVTFPSFHTACGVLLLLAFWQAPYVRWVGVPANILMILSVPIQGSHYIVDVIAGAAVAILAWKSASLFVAATGATRTSAGYEAAPAE